MRHEPLSSISAISFDIDGTLSTHSYPSIFKVNKKFIQQLLCDEFSFSDEQISVAIEYADSDIWNRLPQNDPHYFFSVDDWIEHNRLVLEHLGVKHDLDLLATEYQELWNKLFKEHPRVLKPEVKEILQYLSTHNYKLAISTNWADPSSYLLSYGIHDYFQSIEHSIVPGFRKPSPYMLLQNAREMHVNPLICAYVGDDINADIPAAKNAGMLPILIENFTSPSLTPQEDVITIQELRELTELFE